MEKPPEMVVTVVMVEQPQIAAATYVMNAVSVLFHLVPVVAEEQEVALAVEFYSKHSGH